MRETALQTLRSVKKGREEVLQDSEQTFLCSPWISTVEQIPTLLPTVDPMPEQVNVP